MYGYVKQEDIKPIHAKKWLLDHWQQYDVVDTRKKFIALLNILQAVGSNLEDLYECWCVGYTEYCDIFHNGPWESKREIADALFEFCTFYTDQEFVEMILCRREDYETSKEWSEVISEETTDELWGNNDCQITKTDDGYVLRIWC